METLLQDLRYALRMLLKKPSFAITATLTLALGIGANTAIFTLVNAAVFRSLPYREPARLVHLWETRTEKQFHQMEASYPDYLDWSARRNSFEDLAGYTRANATLVGNSAPERLSGARVTSNFFSVLGVEPALGRFFRDGEDKPGAERIAVLSSALWKRRFGNDPAIVGKRIVLDGDSYEVIGTLPANFHFAKVGSADFWLPLNPDAGESSRRSYHWLNVIGRLKQGVALEQAKSEMQTIAQNLEREYSDTNMGVGANIVELHEELIGEIKSPLLVLLAAVGFVLLIACANAANLLLVRSAARQKEFAVRMALGAGGGRIVRLLLAESLMIALIGGAAGLLAAQWLVELLLLAVPESLMMYMPYLEGLSIDSRILAFTCAMSIFTGFVFGLVPALQASRANLLEALKEGGGSKIASSSRGPRDVLVVVETALSLVLLVGAGLMAKSMTQMLKVDPGFNAKNLLTMNLSLPQEKYSEGDKAAVFYSRLTDRLQNLPGVKGASVVDRLPLGGGGGTGRFQVEGRPIPVKDEYEAVVRTIGRNYFDVMEIPLLGGRRFDERDKMNTPIMVMVNRTFASRAFPNEDPIGRRIVTNYLPMPAQIVGVAGDENVTGLDSEIRPVVYFTQDQDVSLSLCVVVRSNIDPMSIAGAIRNDVQAMDKELPVYGVKTMEQLIAQSPATFTRSYPALLMGVFAALALALAMVGIYGVVSYSVSGRTREIGVRIALGAQKRDIIKLVLKQGMRLALAGTAIGLIASFALAQFLKSLLFGVSAADPITFAGVAALLTATAAAACYIPARRAAKVDPMTALRYE